MTKFFFSTLFILGILIFLTSINFRFSDDNNGKNHSSIIMMDTNRHRSHDVFNDYRPNLVIPPYVYYPPAKDNLLLFTNVDISNNPAPQNEPSVKISRKNPNRVVAAWRDFRQSYNPAWRRVGYSYSTDGGTTWAASMLIDSTLLGQGLLRNSDPSVTTDSAGNFYITTIALDNSNGNGTLAIFKSTDGGVTFTSGQILAQNQDEDKEMVTCDLTPGSPYKNSLYISWSRLANNSDIYVIKSSNSGTSWTTPVNVSTDTTGGQGSDVTVGANGDVYVIWVGGTYTTDFQYFNKSTDGGATFGTPQTIASGPTPNIPISYGYTFPSIACDISNGPRNGYVYATWCDGRNGDADIFISRSTDRGNTWSSAVRVNNDPVGNGKMQCWPWIAVSDSGNIAIIFYDTRNTPSSTIIEAWVARSNDGGVTFSNDVLSSQQSPTNIPNSDVRFGDYIGVDYWNNRVVPVWTDERAGGYDMEIYTAVIVNTTLSTLCEGFNSTTFPPSGWNVSGPGASYWSRQPQSAFGNGSGSAMYDMYFAPTGTIGDLTTISFQPTISQQDSVHFALAYCQWTAWPNDSLIISASTDGGTTWKAIARLGEAQMNTTSSCTHPFTPGPSDWGSRSYPIPVGTNKINFSGHSGYGDHLYIDSIGTNPCWNLTGITQHGSEIPKVYSLSQNYPNPFNPETKINFALPKTGFVKLVVYDILGAEVATLVNENMQAGYHTAMFNGSKFASGVYFYKITAHEVSGSSMGDFTDVKKMVLIK